MGGVMYFNRALSKDVDITQMLNMRDSGMTNKEIAEQLGVSISTIYRYIGKKSVAVKKAEMQAKHAPDKPEPVGLMPKEIETAREQIKPVEPEKERNTLKVISTRQTLQGTFCTYVVDTGSDSVEISGDLLNGSLDRATLTDLIAELSEINERLGG